MSEEPKIRISIDRYNDNTIEWRPISSIETTGYILLNLQGSEIKVSGSIDLKSIAPLLMKLAMGKLSKIM